MMERMLEMTRRLDGSGSGPEARGRRPLAVGRRSPEGSWLWVSPHAEEARRAVPGPEKADRKP